MARGTPSRKEREWRERLARFAREGTSVVEFCDDEGISTPSFYAWRRRLSAATDTSTQAAEVSGSCAKRPGPFAVVRVTGQGNGGSQVTASLRGGMRLDISLNDADTVRLVIEALVRADAEHAGGRPC
jgi:hypothetical protein